MKSFQLRKVFLNFFKKKEHKIYPSSSLIPADPTSLFTSAGMQQFVPFLSGEVKPPQKRVCSVQKCLRMGGEGIDEVGDRYHNSFFEMLGNWSFGDYFKKEAIDMAWEFLLDILKLDKEKLWITVFKGERGIPKDEESIKLWQEKGVSRKKIFGYGMKDNFWGPVTAIGPCGPCSEIFYDLKGVACEKEDCGPNCDCGRFVELWNLVFMEYNKTADSRYEKMEQQNVDTGLGFERTLSILQKKESIYETDLFWPIILEIEKISGKKYKDSKRIFRILADHIRAVCFAIGAGVLPSNTDRGYVLRMLLRRIIRYARILDLPDNWYVEPVKRISEIYGNEYAEVKTKQADIITVIQKEEEKFSRALNRGLKEFEKLVKQKIDSKIIGGQEAFDLFQNYGFPIELTKELAQEKGLKVDEQRFKSALKKHREISRKGAQKKFGGVGIEQLETKDEKKKATRLHTATHLLHAGLRKVLGNHVQQMGSDINPQRLRFDFSQERAMTQEEIKKVENWVNERIVEGLEVKKEEMLYQEALKSGALAFFKQRYPKTVNVYTIQDKKGNTVSKEVCAGPHVKSTSELGIFRIIKEESAGAGIRRIRAILE